FHHPPRPPSSTPFPLPDALPILPPALVMAAYSRSVPTALVGVTPKWSRIGVISEPPPTPVIPTTKPTTKPAITKAYWKSIKTLRDLGRTKAARLSAGRP